MRTLKTDKVQMIVPPKEFENYDWNDDFKLVMFCLEFTRSFLSDQDESMVEEIKQWGYKNCQEVYDLLWSGFKYYKGQAFDEQFSIFKSSICCPRCKNIVEMAEIKPLPANIKYLTP